VIKASLYPLTVIGFDIAGLVLEVGENVPSSDADEDLSLVFRLGITPVAAYAVSFWESRNPGYSVFQERYLVLWQYTAPLPEKGISWNEVATLPISVEVSLNAWDILVIPRLGETDIYLLQSVLILVLKRRNIIESPS
jgi:NADPH:quinone reductase-like Zn-dependent oxidoreductase